MPRATLAVDDVARAADRAIGRSAISPAVHAWADIEYDDTAAAPAAPEPTDAELRARVRAAGRAVPDRGRLRSEIRQTWRDAHHE